MDYSYFNSAPQPYQLHGISSTSGPSQQMDMDNFTTAQQTQTANFDSPFAAFQDSFQYGQSTFVQPVSAQSQLPARAPSTSSAIPSFENTSMPTTDQFAPFEDMFPTRSSSEEKDGMTPQQTKRKAQNRAAQRAFRERKEKHLKDLETKLNTLQQQSVTLDSENERLRKQLARVETENEILRATSQGKLILEEDDEDFGPLGYTPADYASQKERTVRKAQVFGSIQTIVIDDNSNELLLNSNQTWDYIQDHQSFRDGLVDVGDVIDRLKKLARCDGQGPVFRENDILKAISESAVAGGRDEL